MFGPTKFTPNAFSGDIRMSRDSVTVPETNSSHLKMDDCKTILSFLGYILFLGAGASCWFQGVQSTGRGITVNVHPLPSSLDHNDYKYKQGGPLLVVNGVIAYNHYTWPYQWVIGVMILRIGVTTIFTTLGSGPLCC